MLEEMSWEQLREWHQFAQLEPFGEERDDLRAGIVASTIVNSNPYRKKGAKAAKASDFVLKFREVKKAAPKPMNETEFRQAFDGFKEMVKATAGSA
jgi:hypothetical protein